jgi:hypothetical protein
MKFIKILLFLTASALLFSIYYFLNTSKHQVLSSGDIFTHRSIKENGLCGQEEIVRANDNFHIATLNLCEDNIEKIYVENEWIIVKTSCNRVYRKNVATNEDGIITTNQTCAGGSLSKIKKLVNF